VNPDHVLSLIRYAQVLIGARRGLQEAERMLRRALMVSQPTRLQPCARVSDALC
jgi:hypothetical protein